MPASPARATKFTGAARWASGQKCELRRHASASKVRFKVRVVRKLYGMSCCSDAGQQGLSVVWTSFKMIGPSAPPGGHLPTRATCAWCLVRAEAEGGRVGQIPTS